MILVMDASVALKWFFRAREEEGHIDRALAILTGIDAEYFQIVQPPHFLAEVAAVLAREKPETAEEDLFDFSAAIEDEMARLAGDHVYQPIVEPVRQLS